MILNLCSHDNTAYYRALCITEHNVCDQAWKTGLILRHITQPVGKLWVYKFDTRETKHRTVNDASFGLLDYGSFDVCSWMYR